MGSRATMNHGMTTAGSGSASGATIRSPTLRGWVVLAAGYLALYVGADWLTYVQPVLKLGITPWNPQAGITLALLLIYGPRAFPVTGLAAFVSELLVRGAPAPIPLLIASSSIIALGYGVLAAVMRAHGLAKPIESTLAAARFALAAGAATLLVAAAYVALFVGAGSLPTEVASNGMARYWVGDLNGILTVTPLLLHASQWRMALAAVQRRGWEILAQFVVVALMVWTIFGLASTDGLRFFYPLFLPVIWIALRWRVAGAIMAALTIQVGLLILAQDETRFPPYVDLQFLMLTLSLTAVLLGAAVAERADALRRVALRESEQRALLATAPDAVLTADAAGNLLSANPAATRLFGALVATGQPIGNLLPAFRPDSAEGRTTIEGRRANGTQFPAEAAWAAFGAQAERGSLIIVRDATERLRSEAQLRERDTALARAMRFAVAGELASALTHELNQPITALVSYLRASQILAAPFVAGDPRLAATLEKAADEAIRASEVMRRLRDFYRSGSVQQEAVDVHELCAGVVGAFSERLREAGVALEMDIGGAIPGVRANGTQLEIVLHNLLSNALDALADPGVTLRAVVLRARHEERSLTLEVEDSGRGIGAEVAGRLFEPFVTTKADGMGLGLAISRSLLRARGGDLTCRAGPRLGGACFVMTIPMGGHGGSQA